MTQATETTAEALGTELARSIKQRSEAVAAGVAEFASGMAIDLARVQTELAYLSVIVMHFCVGTVLDAHVSGRVAAAFHRELWHGSPWRGTPGAFDLRTPAYQEALNHPHPEFGRGYGIGRAFARFCGATHDVPVIEFGARAYVEQLPPILTLLRAVVVR